MRVLVLIDLWKNFILENLNICIYLSNNRVYACIDLKSFYASVECVERNLDPLTANLVVADESRTEKTICLAVSPSLKSFGISGRVKKHRKQRKIKGFPAY